MASISGVSLSVAAGPTSATKDVTVSGTLTFAAGDIGDSYRLEIKLRGEDLSGDKLPAGDAVGDDDLYTFKYGFINLPYKSISVVAAGTQPFSEKRTLQASTLDEDSGKELVGWADINTPIYMSRADEVYARVTLSGAPVTARSANWTTVGV